MTANGDAPVRVTQPSAAGIRAATAGHYTGPPIAVIGNGPVGQTVALLLARWGVPVVLLDQRPERDSIGSRAICQQRDVLDVWASIGGGRIADEGVTWTVARTFYRDRELFSWRFADRGRSPLPAYVNISQARTEEILDEAIARQPLIDVRWDHVVTRISQDEAAVRLRCATAQGVLVLTAPYAVACAGARGDVVRQSLGVDFAGRTFDDLFLICDIRTELPGWETERRFYFDPPWNPGRQVLIHACPDSTYRIDWQVPGDFDLDEEAGNGGLDGRIRDIIGDRPYRIAWQSVYRFHSRHASRMRVGRVLLAGDCAHLVAPFGARGLNSGVPDAENAAWKLAFVVHGWASDSLLDSYNDERLAAALENLAVTTDTMRFLVPADAAERRARRDVLERARDDPGARAYVDSGRFAEPFWYVDSPLTTPDSSRRFAGRPPRGESPPSAPGLLIADAPITDPANPAITRLREIVRDGLLALATSGSDTDALQAVLAGASAAPSRTLRLGEIDTEGFVAEALESRPGEVWLIRPDGHIAAVVDDQDPAALVAAVRRTLGISSGVLAAAHQASE